MNEVVILKATSIDRDQMSIIFDAKVALSN